MYFFFHLFTGIVLGFLCAELFHDRRWLIPCTIGAILPDLIDKPLGLLVLSSSIGYGRIFTHTLALALLVLGAGIVYWRLRQDPGLFALGTGILSHQVLDLMWRQPVNWYYPFLGSFSGSHTEDFFWVKFLEELHNPFEVILGAMVLILVLAVLFRSRISPVLKEKRAVITLIMTFSALVFGSLAGILIGWGLGGHKLPQIGWGRPEELILGGLVIAAASLLFWRWLNIVTSIEEQ
ncbi:metal-dependent hydrolase [Methanoregula sp.]|uniref:metal-dependent hydrolase n=1 Tax=Methanoregula sp. TaxID=2052170 RepID=UPI0026066CD7|nr:metal-dependent hydrolase [Methanoregula sp.]MDD5141916.1 metal-dependent hydrolase [Methanoregula sp.]